MHAHTPHHLLDVGLTSWVVLPFKKRCSSRNAERNKAHSTQRTIFWTSEFHSQAGMGLTDKKWNSGPVLVQFTQGKQKSRGRGEPQQTENASLPAFPTRPQLLAASYSYWRRRRLGASPAEAARQRRQPRERANWWEQRRGHAGTCKRGRVGPASPSALPPAPGAAGAVRLSRGRLPGREGTGQRQQAAAWAGGLSRLTPAGPRIAVTMLFLLSAVWHPPDRAVPLGCPAEHPSDANLPGERRAEEPGGNPLETTKNIT